ncbi:MAG TPA: sigma-54-dependent Fis family transcriptional regulator [Sedimenticola sp.]|nr:sigma-54-dependent Fis family transcriptional regulator [Sedimenticola sp.]
MSKILIADDEAAICDALSALVERERHTPLVASSGEEALELLDRDSPPVVILDVQMPGMGGLAALKEIKRRRPATVVIVITAYGTMHTAMEAVRLGAFEYLGKPLEIGQVRSLLARALKQAATTPAAVERRDTPPPATDRPELIGQSPVMQEVFKLMGLLTRNDLTVLITGESGVGKELVARGIHDHSARRDHPFIAVNCAAIPPDLLESELFGHEKGAFTGATGQRLGRFESAGKGTLFLDEIGELDYGMQSKLLRVLQERLFERVGSSTSIPLQARILTATNRDLQQEVARGRFREDLFHRINLVNLQVPPLRRRVGDIPLLAEYFLGRANRELDRQLAGFEPEAMALLSEQPWPGNVRELENRVRKAALLARGNRITADDLRLQQAPDGAQSPVESLETTAGQRLDTAVATLLSQLLDQTAGDDDPPPFHRITRRVEGVLVAEALRRTGNNQVAASRLLGINRTTLRKKLRQR